MEKKSGARKGRVWVVAVIGLAAAVVFLVNSIAWLIPSTVMQTQTLLPSGTATQSDCDKAYRMQLTLQPTRYATYVVARYHYCQSIALGTIFPTSLPPTPYPYTSQPRVDTRYRRIAGDGILSLNAGNFPGILATSEWEEKKGSNLIDVTAGLFFDSRYNTEKGGVLVQVYDEYRQPAPGGGSYVTPQADGTVTIIDAQGEQLTLLSRNGTVFTFDVATRKFISSAMPMVANKPQRTASQGTIVEDGASAFTSQGYATSNRWYQDQGSRRITALVGTKKDNPDQGYLILANSPANSDAVTDSQAYPLPKQGGPLRIVDARNNQIVVILNGDLPMSRGVFIFDIAEKRFLSDQERQALPQDPAVLAYDKVLADHPVLPTITLMPQLIRTATSMPAYP